MNEDTDGKLGRLLRGHAPPARDPLFRIRVLEHRERQLLTRRHRMLAGVAVAAAVLPAIVLALSGQLLACWPIVLFGAALVTASVFAVRGVRQALRLWRTGRA